jgi:hypothetical protein
MMDWDWLRGCRDCGKSHIFRYTRCSHTEHPHDGRCGGGTWAAIDDGHSYRSRMDHWLVDDLQREYDGASTSSPEEDGE